MGAVALRFGNCNNGLICGPRARNWNNTAGNANWNIGAAFIYPFWNIDIKSASFLHPWRLKHRYIRDYSFGE